MTSRERVWGALRGEPIDRPPVSFWGHVYDRESSAEGLVEATLAFQREFGWDWVKLNPRKHYHVEPWGVSYRYSGAAKPTLESWPVHSPEDWSRITERDTDAAAFAEQIRAVQLLRRSLPAEVPIVETVFTPLAVLGELVDVPQTLRTHMDSHPERVRAALEATTRSFERLVPALLAAGADGIYLATVDWASRDLMSAEDYRSWARPYDLRILAAAESAPFNVIHVCKSNNLLLEVADYPVAALSWAASDATNPTLADTLPRTRAAVMGGISHDVALAAPDPAIALAELRRGFAETGGRRWLVAPSCSISPDTPHARLRAIRDAVEDASVSRPR